MAFVDNNGLQIDGKISDVMNPSPIDEKFKAFGWNVITLEDGNDLASVIEACEEAKTVKGKPTVVVAKTVKGKGVSFMENVVAFHGKTPSKEEYENGMKELEEVSL